MSIMGFIKQSKDKFAEYKASRIRSQARRLEDDKQRLGTIAKANAELQKQKRDVEAIQSYNRKVTGPSRLQKLAEGLNKAQARVKNIKEPKGIKKSKLQAENRSIQMGSDFSSRNNPVGSPFSSGGSSSPFSMGFGSSNRPKRKGPFEF